MSYLDHTRPYNGKPLEYTLCLTVDECKLLLPVMKTALKWQQKLYDKYRDIQDSGEATTRQQTALMGAETGVAHLEDAVEKAQELIKLFEK